MKRFWKNIYSYKEIKDNFPVKSFVFCILIWIFSAIFYYIIQSKINYSLGVGYLFPISVIYPSNFLLSGFLFGFLFLIIGYFGFTKREKFSAITCYLFCFLLILVGNLIQGNFDIAFLQPIYKGGYNDGIGRQYYHDAIEIQNWWEWLKNFNENQESLRMHTRTHPPFVVLFQYLLLQIFGGSVFAISLTYSLLASFTFIFIRKILSLFIVNIEKINLLTLLFAIIPSVNIYSIVSLDGVILTFSVMALYGLVKTWKENRISLLSIIYTFLGFALASSFTFGSSFMIGALGVFSLYQILINKNYLIFKFLIICGFLLLGYLFSLYLLFDYNHLETFFIALQLENPQGFRAFNEPIIYLNTRLEGIGEVLLFLSFGFLSVIITGKQKYFGDKLTIKSNLANIQLFFSAIIIFIAMLLTGAYGTGETARACIFIYPFFLLTLINSNAKMLNIIYFLALFQTFGMQLVGNYYW